MLANKKFGFTLIELLVVISIIGILTGVVVMNFNAIRERARDSERQSDLKQYATSWENYANNHNGLYLVSGINGTIDNASAFCSFLTDNSQCPDDDPTYKYWTNASGTEYMLWADLESDGVGTGFWIVCSNGKVGKATNAPSVTFACPL